MPCVCADGQFEIVQIWEMRGKLQAAHMYVEVTASIRRYHDTMRVSAKKGEHYLKESNLK